MLVATTIGAQALPDANANRYRALDTFAQSLSYISTNYVDPVDERSLIYGAVHGMVSRLDSHSTFLSPEQYKRLRQDTEGEFGGVGLSLGMPNDVGIEQATSEPIYPVVENVVLGAPAARAGIQVGDSLLAVDGLPTADKGTDHDPSIWHSRLRGATGTKVKLEVSRASWPKPRTLILIRERVKVPTVESFTVEPRIGYIAVKKFQEATVKDVTLALRQLSRTGLDVLILDLRGNPGGLLDQGVRVADLFLDKGMIVIIRGRDTAKEEREVAHAPGTWTDMRMLVLVDQGTASAAEIVAGALQDNHRATIMGLRSYGKGSVQTFIDLKDGSGLKLTTARYYTPSDKSLERTGITPDIEVEAFAPEIIEVGPAAAKTPGANDGKPDIIGGAGLPKNATIPNRLVDDHQFEVARETAKRWLGSKTSTKKP